ncbi:sialate O-acetylesterase-like [Saccoglossus kowalevskii]
MQYTSDAKADSVLWNAMIYPLLNITIKGVVWYQGESNTIHGIKQDSYSCTFPAMIADWRDKFYIGTGGETDKLFPFGFVQVKKTINRKSAAVTRESIQKTFKITENVSWLLPKVHPRYKQDVGYRLALAAKAIAYNDTNVKYAGPFPSNITVVLSGDAINVIYDSKHIRVNQDSGFEVCCSSTNNCTDLSNDWLPAPIISTIDKDGIQISTVFCDAATLQAVRYAWRDYPCSYKQCTIYDNDSNLPAPLFVFSLKGKY